MVEALGQRGFSEHVDKHIKLNNIIEIEIKEIRSLSDSVQLPQDNTHTWKNNNILQNQY